MTPPSQGMVTGLDYISCNGQESHMDQKSPKEKLPWVPWKRNPCFPTLQRWNTFPFFNKGLVVQPGIKPPQQKLYQSNPHLSSLIQQRPPISWARQQGLLQSPAVTPSSSHQQMTVGALQARSRPLIQSMESRYLQDPFALGQGICDHSLTDLGSIDASIYASSPNSLYMYDLEKSDMQSSFGTNVSCGNVNQWIVSDDFELNDKYETSQDILPKIGDASSSQVAPTATATSSGMDSGKTWEIRDLDSKNDDVFETLQDSPSTLSEPTLAELNSESLLDDFTSLATVTTATATMAETKAMPSNIYKVSNTGNLPLDTAWAPMKTSGTVSKLVNQSVGGVNLGSDWTSISQSRRMDCGLLQPLPQTLPILNKAPTASSQRHKSETVSSLNLKDNVFNEIQSPVEENKDLVKFLVNKIPLHSQSSMSDTPSSTVSRSPLHPGKRRSPQSTVSFDPSGVDVDQKWEEIKQFIYDDDMPTKPKVKRESRDSVGSAITSTSIDDLDSDLSSDEDDNWPTDSDSDGSQDQDTHWSSKSKESSRKKERQYFWQYNIQSKGPKGTRMSFDLDTNNPHVLKDFEDPVFDSNTGGKLSGAGNIRHGGKARKGDGNDIAPNPKKLFNLGQQLRKLNKQINTFAPLCEMPVSTRNKSKKEKNKLASRACRLKKKAQHEAYKVKLYGLELEHRQLMNALSSVRSCLKKAVEDIDGGNTDRKPDLAKEMEALIKEKITVRMVAGNTTDYVNYVVKCVEDGDPKGGLGT